MCRNQCVTFFYRQSEEGDKATMKFLDHYLANSSPTTATIIYTTYTTVHQHVVHEGISQGSIAAISKAVTISVSPTWEQHGANPHRCTIIRLLYTRISPLRSIRINQ